MKAVKNPSGRAPKGNVSVEPFQNRLRLRFRVEGKQKALTLGLDDTPENRKRAEIIARQMELDLSSGEFDFTLSKYKPQKKQSQQNQQKLDPNTTVSQLFQAFMDSKAEGVYKRTLEKYRATIKYLNQFECNDKLQKCIGDKPACLLGDECAQAFAEWLKDKNGERVRKERLQLLSAAWEWGEKKRVVEYNPWKILQDRVKVPPKQPPKPFTKAEIQAIITEFRSDPHYKHYAAYVAFMFATGMRTGEGIGLTWGVIADDFSTAWIGESLTHRKRKTTKTNKARTILLGDEVREILKAIKPENAKATDPVFITRQGNPLDEHNFSQRAWRTILERLNIPYRRPYNSRSSFVSHCLEAGNSPSTIAAHTGHDVRVLYQNYAGAVNNITLPKLF